MIRRERNSRHFLWPELILCKKTELYQSSVKYG
jgi:hypothetical protein